MLLLLLLAIVTVAIWLLGIGISLAIGGFITSAFHLCDAGLLTFIGLSIAWTVYMLRYIVRELRKALAG